MSKKIEELFNLPSVDDEDDNEVVAAPIASTPQTTVQPTQFEDDHAEFMDKLAEETLGHAGDLMEFGYSAEERAKATIFEKAIMLYNTSITAKKTKRDAQHKEYDLQLRLRRLELDEKKFALQSLEDEGKAPIKENNGVGFFDRNEIVKRAIEDKSSSHDE